MNSLRHNDYVAGLLHGLSLGLGSAIMAGWILTMAWLLYAIIVFVVA